MPEIPISPHPGSFGAIRKHDIHTGIDLYAPEGTNVYAVEDGIVVNVEAFTGPNVGSPWWNETHAILIEGRSGVILYGEMEPLVKNGECVNSGDLIGKVKTVLRKDKGNPMSMLHFELYKHGTKESVWWHTEKPDCLMNPTDLLLSTG